MKFDNIDAFLIYYERIRARTIKVIQCIPPDYMDWTIKEGKFTLGDLVRHIAAIEREMYAETIRGNFSKYAGCGPELAKNYEDILVYFDEMHRQTIEILEALTPEDLKAKCLTPVGTKITSWKWLRAMVEHEIHHRGPIFSYLGFLDVAPPSLFGLTSAQLMKVSHY